MNASSQFKSYKKMNNELNKENKIKINMVFFTLRRACNALLLSFALHIARLIP